MRDMRDSDDKFAVNGPGHDLRQANGPLLSGAALHRALGFQTGAGFRQAFKRGQLPIATFRLPGRRDRFALTADVAAWLDRLGVVGEKSQAPGGDAMS